MLLRRVKVVSQRLQEILRSVNHKANEYRQTHETLLEISSQLIGGLFNPNLFIWFVLVLSQQLTHSATGWFLQDAAEMQPGEDKACCLVWSEVLLDFVPPGKDAHCPAGLESAPPAHRLDLGTFSFREFPSHGIPTPLGPSL